MKYNYIFTIWIVICMAFAIIIPNESIKHGLFVAWIIGLFVVTPIVLIFFGEREKKK